MGINSGKIESAFNTSPLEQYPDYMCSACDLIKTNGRKFSCRTPSKLKSYLKASGVKFLLLACEKVRNFPQA